MYVKVLTRPGYEQGQGGYMHMARLFRGLIFLYYIQPAQMQSRIPHTKATEDHPVSLDYSINRLPKSLDHSIVHS